MRLVISNLIESNYQNHKFGLFLVYGAMGVGKSTYCLLAIKELGLNWKEHVFFRPKEFLEKITEAYKKHERLKVLVLDDAGYHLSSYEWHDPFVKEFVKFISIPRPVIANIIITTPSPTLLVKKIRTMDSYVVKIISNSSKDHPHRRMAKGYKNVLLPNGFRYTRLIFEDEFSLNALDETTRKEYDEYRYTYVGDALTRMTIALRDREKDVENRDRFIQA